MIRNAVKKKLKEVVTGEEVIETIPEKDGMIFAHLAFRRDLEHFEEALEHLDPNVVWQQRNLWRWWQQWGAMVHHHHDIEEEILFPWLLSKVDLPPQVSTDHEELLKQMEAISSMQAKFSAAESSQERAALLEEVKGMFSTFKQFMNTHLDLEDASITHELLCEHFSYEEYEKNTQEIALKGGVISAAKTTRDMLSWFEQGMSEEEVKEFYTVELPKHIPMPRVIAYTNKLRWKDRYFSHHVALLESIIQGTKKPSKKVERERRTMDPTLARMVEQEEISDSDVWEDVGEEAEADGETRGSGTTAVYEGGRDGMDVIWQTKRPVGIIGYKHSHTLEEAGDYVVTADVTGMAVKGKRRYLCVTVKVAGGDEREMEVGGGERKEYESVRVAAEAGQKLTVRAKSKAGPIRTALFIEKAL